MQRDALGDLVLNVEVHYSEPEPAIAWRDGTLLVELGKNQPYRYFAGSIDGVPVMLERGDNSEKNGERRA